VVRTGEGVEARLLGGARLVERMRGLGLPMCRPRILPVADRTTVLADCYNVALALRMGAAGGEVVPNDVRFDAQDGRVWILTGPNRSGKTTYLGAVALAHVLAQAGLFVPARDAALSPADALFVHFPARERGLLGMGPDCGTAILGGVGLGFANVVRRGGIGLVGASGTGLQEVSCLLHNAGLGISHAIGTGGRDLHAAVGGITTLQALDLLAADPSTHTIVLVSKPPSPTVAERVLEAALQTGKRVVGYLPGTTSTPGGPRANSLYETARLAANGQGDWPTARIESVPRLHFGEQQRQIRGLYCGGTLCDEAEATLQAGWAGEHVFVDFGDDRYTRGRAHPMIDPSLRNQAIVDAGHDPRVAVLLLDVILGYGAHANPAAAVAPAIRAAIEAAEGAGRSLAVFAHVVGTPADPQPLEQQIAALASAGVVVFDSNHHAALAAGELVGGVGR
jgi:FdrA protein